MTLLFYPDAGDWVDRIRLGDGFALTEAAESGLLSMSRVTVDDPLANITIVGHHAFRAIETACSWQTLFRGYFADRTIKRGPSFLTGAARVWDCSVADANSVLYFEVLRGNDANRPAETDTERIAWLLGSNFKGPVLDDDTYVLGYDVDLDKADYRGQTMADVLSDCATASKANYFVTYDEVLGGYVVHYYRPTRAFYSSTLRISNVLSDVDGVTTFAASGDGQMTRDPSRIFSGVYYTYGDKNAYVFEESSAVLAAIGHRRETSETADETVRTATKATNKADRWLEEADTDLDTVTVTIHRLPPSKVNLIRAGMRIQIRMTHLPGLSSFAWMRVTRRTVAQDGETQQFYRLDLELADPKQLGKKRRGKPVPVAPEVEDGDPVSFQRWHFKAQEDRNDGQGGLANDYNFSGPGGTPNEVTSATLLATPGIFVGGGCSSPAVGYSGIDTVEQWIKVTGTPATGTAGLRVTLETGNIEGVAASSYMIYGYSWTTPQRPGEWAPLGTCATADGTSFVVPISILNPSGDTYIVIGPGWIAMNGDNVCSDNIPGGHPLDSGYANSGQLSIDDVDLVEVTVVGSGETLWRSPEEPSDGETFAFTLTDWNGTGTPRMRIGPLEYAEGTDYTVDRDAKTVTFFTAPWEGAAVTGRYNT